MSPEIKLKEADSQSHFYANKKAGRWGLVWWGSAPFGLTVRPPVFTSVTFWIFKSSGVIIN